MCSAAAAGDRTFGERLAALREISMDLAEASLIGELCRSIVEWGRQRLGFDRAGILLVEQEPDMVRGSYGTVGEGRTRDEREWFGPAKATD